MGWIYNATPEVTSESNYPLILESTIPLLVLMILTVSTRLYVRLRTVRGIGADDWSVVIAAVCSIIYSSFTVAQSRWGLGLPLALRPRENLNSYSVLNFAGRPFYQFGVLFFKVSLCFSYQRILSKGQPNYRILVWIILALCIIGHVVGTLVLILSCNPVQKSWQPATPGTCLPVGPLFYGLAIVTIVFDVIIFFLPIPFLQGLRMDRQRKWGVMAVFALGIFTTACSIIRMTQIPAIVSEGGNSTLLVLWGNIEIDVGIILTCLPVLAPLFKVLRQKLSSSDRSQGNPYLHTGNHGLQVFSGNESNNRNTITVANARLGRASRYPEDESDNESQETILGKGVGEIEGTMGSRDVERDAGRGEGRSVNGGQSQIKKETGGIMRTMEVRVDVESGPSFEGR